MTAPAAPAPSVTRVLHEVVDWVSDTLVAAATPYLWGGLRDLAETFPAHDSFDYVTAHSLGPAYLAAARATLADRHVYVVASNTKTTMNKIVSRLTRDPYNHASLAFDAGLATLISCNGGQPGQTPGLNRETVADLLGRQGAEYVVLAVPVTRAQKAAIIDLVAAIDAEGSSYNLIGLVTKRAAKPNIMFCSQFVYRVLDEAGASYFDRDPCHVKPHHFLSWAAAPVVVGPPIRHTDGSLAPQGEP